MLKSDTHDVVDVAPATAQGEPGEEGADRRRAYRRRLPFGRGAVLLVEDRAHIVGLADVSITGAYLTTRAPVSAGEVHLLKLLLLPERIELAVRAEVVRIAQDSHESAGHPRGVGVRFLELDEETRRRLESFIAREPRRARR
jgi:c-di-GMP-binding flagellar brake protein YcgR